jgi:cytosine/adenosine deaminase-related metal-dependent hydrolase
MPKYLLKGGNVLQFNADKQATFPKLDVLIEDNKIAKVGSDLAADSGVEVIDAHGHIVSPGFIDGHRHVFQAQLRGTVADHGFIDYCAHLSQGRMAFFSADDMYLAQLAGLSEAVWAGVTTVMDHSRCIGSKERSDKVIKATVESGARCVLCVCPFASPESFNPTVMPDMDVEHPKQVALFKDLVGETPLGGASNDGRVTLGLAYDTISRRDVAEGREILQYCKDKNIPVTVHDVERFGLFSFDFVKNNNLPIPKLTMSHSCEPKEDKVAFIRENNIAVVSTPETEMAMGHGHPSCFDLMRAGCRVGLGVDVPGFCSGDMFAAMRLALQNQRARENADYHTRNKLPNVLKTRVDHVLWMGTQGGAAAIHQEDKIGSIEEGKLADVVLIKAESPSTVSSMNHGATVVLHCNANDVDTVFVNGEIVKKDNKLLKVDWPKLCKELGEHRLELEKKWHGVDWEGSKDELVKAWHFDGILE